MASANYYYYNYIHSALEAHQDPHELSLDLPVVLHGREDYREWRRAMNLELEMRKMLWFVHGTVPERDPFCKAWETRNERVLSWIRGSISPEIKKIVEDMPNDAVVVWRGLKELYSPGHQIILSDIKEEINSLKQETRTLMEYKILFDALWMEYEMLDENKDKSKRFLEGLNERFHATRSRIMKVKPFPSLERVFNLVAQEDDETRILVMQIQPESYKVVHNIEDTRIEKKQIVLPGIHEHALTSTPAGAPYSCYGCKERGCGRSYRCEEKNCSGCVLHEECVNAVLERQNKVSHPFFKGEVFEFLEKPLGHPRVCDACRMEVQGFVYHRKATKDVYDTGLDLHPCCLKLSDKISYKDSGATKTLTLRRNVEKKCVKCKSRKVGDDSKVKGWSYVTSDGDCYHVSCFKELFLEKFRGDYFSEKKVVASKMQINTVGNNTKVVKVRGGSKSKVSSVAKKMVVKIAPVILKALFAAIFGDPVSFVLTLVEALATAFN